MDIDKENIDMSKAILRADKGMGNGKITDIQDLIYVDPRHFDRLRTEQMAEEIARELAANGIKEIVLHNVSHEDPSYILQNIFRYRGLIIGSPTYSNRLFPAVETLTEMIATRDIKNRTFAYFGSFTWAGAAVKHLAAFAESMKWETIPCCIEMKQSITPAIKEQCRNLAQEMAARLTR